MRNKGYFVIDIKEHITKEIKKNFARKSIFLYEGWNVF